MQPSCGTLDCHGRIERNLRLYGGRGLRLGPLDNAADGATTQLEYQANHRATVGLEPEVIDAVVRGGDPESLSLIRKARGNERHKGGTQMLRNDPLDLCLVGWVTGKSDLEACKRVSNATGPATLTTRSAP
jgi:hypothetical protein